MAADNHVRSYGDVSKKESVVLNAVEILTARETFIFNMLGKTRAIESTHSYLTDTLKAAAANAQNESDDYSYLARTTPSRLTNIIQHVQIPYVVSDTQRAIEHYHGRDELERQTEKALMEWANDAEFNLVRSTLTSGASGTAPAMSGIIEAISKGSNHTSHTSGTVWSATILDGLVADNYDNSNGDLATDLFMGSFLRKATDGFTQKSNVVVNGPTVSTIVRTVSTYQTAFSTLNIHTHRYVQQSGDATGRVLAINPQKLRVAFLEQPFIDTEVARTGPHKKRSVNGSLTLEVHNQDSNFFADGFDKD
jgi:hypothetical protein